MASLKGKFLEEWYRQRDAEAAVAQQLWKDMETGLLVQQGARRLLRADRPPRPAARVLLHEYMER